MAAQNVFKAFHSPTVSRTFIKQIYPEIYHTRTYCPFVEHIIQSRNIKLVIIIDRNHGKGKEYIDPIGNDIFITEITIGKPGNPIIKDLRTCDEIARLLKKAKTAHEKSMIIDYNNHPQKTITAVAAYLMYHETQNYCKAITLLTKYYNNINLNKYYSSLLYDYEHFIHIRLKHLKNGSVRVMRNFSGIPFFNNVKILKGGKPKCNFDDDYEDKVAMVQHLNAGKRLESYLSEKDVEKNNAFELGNRRPSGYWYPTIKRDGRALIKVTKCVGGEKTEIIEAFTDGFMGKDYTLF